MTQRFVARQHSAGWSVIDRETGEAAMIAMTPQTRLSEPDARHTANLLNLREAATPPAISA